ncbi:MAG: hypothetical protein WCS37_14755 [Chloroflexota bacterium]|nr:hypothetical protein [Chloroflexota bacterium]
MSKSERECPVCKRIYEAEDVPDDTCPFCEPLTPLQAVGGLTSMIGDLFSTGLGWPQGEERVLVTISPNYMDAQLTKAQLESNDIPVMIEGGGVGNLYNFTIGNLAEHKIYVPQSLLPQARQILKM